MNIRPYTLVSASQAEAVRDVVEARASIWVEQWGLQADWVVIEQVSVVSDENRCDSNTVSIYQYADAEEQWLACSPTSDLPKVLGALLVGNAGVISDLGNREDSLAIEIVDKALADLSAQLMQQPVSRVSKADSNQGYSEQLSRFSDYGSGAILITCSIKNAELSIVVPYECWVLWLDDELSGQIDAEVELTRLRDSISDQRVSARVVLGSSKVNVGALASLQEGDVIRLDKSLNDPLEILFGQSASRCKGFIGKQDDRFAIQIDSVIKS